MTTKEDHDEDDEPSHEPSCPIRNWDRKSGETKPACECLGIDYSELLMDGDDCYD